MLIAIETSNPEAVAAVIAKGMTSEADVRKVEAGGHVIGVGCRIFKGKLNPHIREEVQTDSLFARLQSLIELGDAFIVMPGSTGTLAELALVWELMNKQLLARKPILCWGEFWRPVVQIFSGEMMQDPRIHTLGITEQRGALIQFVHSVQQAMDALDPLAALPSPAPAPDVEGGD